MALIIFWSLVLVTAVVMAVLRDVTAAAPRRDALLRLNGHAPPRSHHDDEFDRTGSAWH